MVFKNNDPVMGGRSVGTTTLTSDMLVFNGSVVNVPSLKGISNFTCSPGLLFIIRNHVSKAPGFITSVSTDKTSWADASGCKNLAIKMRCSTHAFLVF